ncbi:hypothetical protein DENSPDRAFT_884655, partial [Dentipellis sp. KUC8613]
TPARSRRAVAPSRRSHPRSAVVPVHPRPHPRALFALSRRRVFTPVFAPSCPCTPVGPFSRARDLVAPSRPCARPRALVAPSPARPRCAVAPNSPVSCPPSCRHHCALFRTSCLHPLTPSSRCRAGMLSLHCRPSLALVALSCPRTLAPLSHPHAPVAPSLGRHMFFSRPHHPRARTPAPSIMH